MFVQAIYLFVSVVESGSFSKAAKMHYMSQSAVSQQIAKLEKSLGYTLFDRNGYRPSLTKAGKYYYDHVKKLIEEYQRVEKESLKIANDMHDKLVVGVTRGFEMKVVTSIIKNYNMQHDIKVEIRVNSSKDNMNLLKQGEIDIAFGYDYLIKNDDSFKSEKLYRYNLCAIVPNEGKWVTMDEINFKDLNSIPVVLLNKEIAPKTYDYYISTCLKHDMIPEISRETDNIYELTTAVRLNEGIGYTAKELVDLDKDLKYLKINDHNFTCDFCLVYSKNDMKNTLEELVHYLITSFHKL